MGIVSASYTISDLSDGANVFFLNTTRSAEQAILEAWGSNGGGNWLFTEITSDYSAVVPGDTCWMRCTNTSKDGYTYVGMVVSSVSATALIPASGCGIIDKGDAGISITNVVEHYLAYTSDSGVTTSTSGWDIDITLDFTKKYLWNYETINYSDNTHTDTTPRVIGYYKDKGISSIDEYYATSQNTTKPAISSFSTTRPTLDSNTNKYLWNFSLITYTDGSHNYSTDVEKLAAAVIIGVYGDKGDRGVSLVGITEHYLASALDSGVTTSTSGWDIVVDMTPTLKYLWNYETVAYSEGASVTTTPRIIGYYKDKGISSITEYYALSTNTTKPADNVFIPFDPTIHILTSTNKYLWNYSVTTYTDNSTSGGYSTALIIGTYGDKGDRGISFTGINEHYLASSEASGVTTSTAGWDIVTELTATLKYLWNYETINYSEGSPVNTTPRIVGYYKDKGISSIVEYYALSTTTTKPASSSFTPTVKTIDATNKYLWNYTLITYTDGSTSGGYANAMIIGTYGDKGDKGDSPTARPQYALLYEDDEPTALTEWSDEVPSGWVMGYSYWTRTQYEYPDGSFEYSDPIRDTVYNQYMRSQSYLRVATDKTMYVKNLRDPNSVEITVSPVYSGYQNPVFSWTINGITYSTTTVTLSYLQANLPDIIDVTCNLSSTVNNIVYSASANTKIYITDNTRYNVNFDIHDSDPSDPTQNFVDGDSYTKHTTTGGVDNYIPYVYNNGSWIEITNVSLYPEQISQIRDSILSKGINIPISSEAIYGFFKNASIQNAQIDTLSTSEITLQDGGSIQSDNYQVDSSGNPLAGFKIDSTGRSVFVNSLVKDSIVSGSFISNALETQDESPGIVTSGVWENASYYCDKDAYDVISQHTTANAITSVNGTFGSDSFTEILDIKSNEEKQKLRVLSSSNNIETSTSISANIPLNSTVKVNGSIFERKIDTFYYHTNRISTTEYSLNNTNWTSFSNQVSINATYGQAVYARQTINIPQQVEVGDLNTVQNLNNPPFSLPENSVFFQYDANTFIQVENAIIINGGSYGGMYRSIDYGNSWQEITFFESAVTPGYTSAFKLCGNKNGTIVAIASLRQSESPYANIFWAYWSDDGGLTWNQASTPALSDSGPSHLKVSDDGEFRAFSSFDAGCYWKSVDNGRTWQTVTDSRFAYEGCYQLYGNGRWVDFVPSSRPNPDGIRDRLSFTNGLFIWSFGSTVGSTHYAQIYTSTDGTNWNLISNVVDSRNSGWQSNIFYFNGYYYILAGYLYRTNDLSIPIKSWERTGTEVYAEYPSNYGVVDYRARDNIHYVGGSLIISNCLLAAYHDSKDVGFINYGKFTPSDWKTANKGNLSINYDYQNYSVGANLLKTVSSPKARTVVGLIKNSINWQNKKTTISSWSLNPQYYVKFSSFMQNLTSISNFDYKKYVNNTTFTIRFQTYGNSAVNISSPGQDDHYYNLKWNGLTFNVILDGIIRGSFSSSDYFMPNAVITFTPFGTMDAIIVKEILPRLDSQYGIGAQGNEFATAYINNIYGNLTGDVTGNASTATNATNASNSSTTDKINSSDTRNDNPAPNTITKGLTVAFKTNSVIGISGHGDYCGLITFRPYGSPTDFSGGPVQQLAFCEDGMILHRTGSSSGWGSWNYPSRWN